MSMVGRFPGMGQTGRVMRYPPNPMDKCTIVSIFPKAIDEIKHTIQPGRFQIAPGSYENPSILVVGSSSWWREIDDEQPLLEIPTSSVQVADSVVRDYCIGVLGYDAETSMPGLFYLLGALDVDQIKTQYTAELDKAKRKQNEWYGLLIRLADSLWARSNGNPLTIGDDMRMAARELGHTVKDWMKDFRMVDMVKCKACGGLRNPEYPICPVCKSIDPTHPDAEKLVFAQ